MKIFKMTADVEFEADDIVDAFRKLSEHFTCMANETDDVRERESQLFIGGQIDIKPLEQSNDQYGRPPTQQVIPILKTWGKGKM